MNENEYFDAEFQRYWDKRVAIQYVKDLKDKIITLADDQYYLLCEGMDERIQNDLRERFGERIKDIEDAEIFLEIHTEGPTYQYATSLIDDFNSLRDLLDEEKEENYGDQCQD